MDITSRCCQSYLIFLSGNFFEINSRSIFKNLTQRLLTKGESLYKYCEVYLEYLSKENPTLYLNSSKKARFFRLKAASLN